MDLMNKKKGFLIESFRYLIAGGLTTVVNLAIYYGVNRILGHYIVATVTAFIISVAVAYFLNCFYVFKQTISSVHIIQFYGSRVSTFLIETGGLILLVETFKLDEFFSKIIMTIVIVILNYLISKFWIFKGEINE